MTNEQEMKRPIVLYIVIALLAAAVSTLVLIDVAELQAVASLSVRVHNQGDTTRPALDLGLGVIITVSLVPLALVSVAMLRHWSLPYFLAWMFAIVLAMLLLAAATGFTTYRYWRDYQVVSGFGSTG